MSQLVSFMVGDLAATAVVSDDRALEYGQALADLGAEPSFAPSDREPTVLTLGRNASPTTDKQEEP